MRIAQIAPLWVPVPPRTHGGTEFIVSILTEELRRRGHDVTLFASGDSRTSGQLISTCPRALWRDPSLKDPHACIMHLLAQVASRARDFNIIHNHAGFYFAPFARYLKTHAVMTLHRPIQPESHRLLLQEKDFITFVAISRDQAQSAAPLPIARVIYNGLPLDRYTFSENPKGYALFLSRIAPDKGIIEAIEAARLAEKKLIIAGNIVRRKAVGQDDYDFFIRRIKPRIDGTTILYVGEVEFARKVELLQGADVLLFPVRRREPFGLVPVEAMACGTPVIAFRAGSTPELIEHGKTGFLVKSIREMADAIPLVKEIRRSACREEAEKRFTLTQMVDEYEKLYNELLGHTARP